METRQQRGIVIATSGDLRQKGPVWVARSQSGNGSYVVDPTAQIPNCTCPDFETTGRKCKHLYAVEYAIRHSVKPNDETTVEQTKRGTYAELGSVQRRADRREAGVANLLHALCSAIDNPAHKNGRPRLPLSDAIFCSVMKNYGVCRRRRSIIDMEQYAEGGYSKGSDFNSILNVLENPEGSRRFSRH